MKSFHFLRMVFIIFFVSFLMSGYAAGGDVIKTPTKALPEAVSVAKADPSAKPVKGKISLREIHFKQMDGKSRVAMTLSGDPQYEVYRISEKTIAIDIKNGFAPKHLQKGMNTSEFDSAINYIDIKNVKNDIRVLLRLREETPYETTKEGNNLFFDIEKPKRVVTRVEPPPPVAVPREAPPTPKVEEAPVGPRKISLDFKDADIRNILRLIAEVEDKNIILADDVTGNITMRLVDVPSDQAFDIILQTRGLGKREITPNIIRVAPIDTFRKEEKAQLEEIKAKEKLEEMVTELITLNYATAKDVVPQVKGVLSERGDVKVDDRTNTLIIRDVPKKFPDVRSMLKELDTKTPQVLIEARIVEASLGFQRELGVSWGFEAHTKQTNHGVTTREYTVGGATATSTPGVTPGSTIGTTLGAATSRVVDLPAIAQGGIAGGAGTAGVIEFLLTSIYGLRQLDIAISAHENKGDVKIISSPKIATVHNKKASIEQGLRIPYRKITPDGAISTEFVEANLKLTVTPLVTRDGNVKLTIEAKKDAADWTRTVDGVPSIDKKEAITEVLVKDNGVVVIAGVYSIEKTEGTEGIPLFSKIPLLGWLFKREAKSDSRKDLLIFISPKIIKDQA